MEVLDLDALARIAREVVEEAAEYLATHPPTTVREKADRDVITDVDLAIEDRVRARLARLTPNLGFLGEENGATGNRDTYWVLDPVDGTANFCHGMPLHTIALGLVQAAQPIIGVVTLPALGHHYWAVRGGGAYRDGVRLRVAGAAGLAGSLIALGDYGTGPRSLVGDLLSMALDRELTARAQGVRRLGSTVLELVWVADGSIDASITLGNRTWDTAAAALIAREAGALVMDADGSAHTTRSRCAIACAPALREELVGLLAIARDTVFWPADQPW